MSYYNKVMIMGRLTRDPELRYTPQGTAVSEIGVAINREFTVGTERRKETTFVDVTLWKRQAEVVCQYLKKGQPIFVEGRLSFDSWETQDGQKRSRLRVVAENFQFLGSRQGGDASSAGGGGEDAGESFGPAPPRPSFGSRAPARPAGPGQGPPPAARGAPPKSAPEGEGGEEEGGPLGLDESEIPF
jgi:single-strand DNA-binding protein